MTEKVFGIDFLGHIKVKAKSSEEANDIFWAWVADMQDKTRYEWCEVVAEPAYFEQECIEEG